MQIQHWMLVALIAASPCAAPISAAQEPLKTIKREAVPAASPGKRLDLRAPKIAEVFSQAAIDRALHTARDPDTLEEVEVEARRSKAEPRSPIVPGGILAPFWALANPTQAWRILAPLPPDQANSVNNTPPDATDSYRPPTLPPR